MRLLVGQLHRTAAGCAAYDFAGWKDEITCWGSRGLLQRQAGDNNCGVWVCMWALAVVLGLGVRHLDVEDRQHMAGVRVRILMELLRGALLS